MNKHEATIAMELALGRLFRLGSRPEQPGDVDEYHRLRLVALTAADVLGTRPEYQPNWVRDRRSGAAGD